MNGWKYRVFPPVPCWLPTVLPLLINGRQYLCSGYLEALIVKKKSLRIGLWFSLKRVKLCKLSPAPAGLVWQKEQAVWNSRWPWGATFVFQNIWRCVAMRLPVTGVTLFSPKVLAQSCRYQNLDELQFERFCSCGGWTDTVSWLLKCSCSVL